jgi:hypothetical protein
MKECDRYTPLRCCCVSFSFFSFFISSQTNWNRKHKKCNKDDGGDDDDKMSRRKTKTTQIQDGCGVGGRPPLEQNNRTGKNLSGKKKRLIYT